MKPAAFPKFLPLYRKEDKEKDAYLPFISSPAVLLKLDIPAVVSVFQCTRPAGDARILAESVIFSFAGLTCPS